MDYWSHNYYKVHKLDFDKPNWVPLEWKEKNVLIQSKILIFSWSFLINLNTVNRFIEQLRDWTVTWWVSNLWRRWWSHFIPVMMSQSTEDYIKDLLVLLGILFRKNFIYILTNFEYYFYILKNFKITYISFSKYKNYIYIQTHSSIRIR